MSFDLKRSIRPFTDLDRRFSSLEPIVAYLVQQSRDPQSTSPEVQNDVEYVKTHVLSLLNNQEFATVVKLLQEIHHKTREGSDTRTYIRGFQLAIHHARNRYILPLFGEKIHHTIVDIILDQAFCGSNAQEILHDLTVKGDTEVHFYCHTSNCSLIAFLRLELTNNT